MGDFVGGFGIRSAEGLVPSGEDARLAFYLGLALLVQLPFLLEAHLQVDFVRNFEEHRAGGPLAILDLLLEVLPAWLAFFRRIERFQVERDDFFLSRLEDLLLNLLQLLELRKVARAAGMLW